MDAHVHESGYYSDEDYIDMEVSSQANIFCHDHSNGSPSAHPREFEFQMLSSSSQRDTTTSPADELFYKGKLLPLHLPPRLQLVEKLLQNPSTYDAKTQKTDESTYCEELFSTPLFTPTSNTPFESCNISPVESCQVSRELNPEDYLYEYLEEAEAEAVSKSSSADHKNSKKSWTRKLKMIKRSGLGSKLKASRAYIKSFFNKSGCSYKSSTAAEALKKVVNEESVSRAAMKAPFGHISSSSVTKSFRKEEAIDDGEKSRHRRSFSGAIKRLSSSSSSSLKFSSSDSSSGVSSASSSNNSNGFQEMQFFKRSTMISSNLEVENPIQAAIAHCKMSHQQLQQPRKTVSDLGLCSLSASRVIREDQERQTLCRG